MKKRSPAGNSSDSALKKWVTCDPRPCQSFARSTGRSKRRSRRTGMIPAAVAEAADFMFIVLLVPERPGASSDAAGRRRCVAHRQNLDIDSCKIGRAARARKLRGRCALPNRARSKGGENGARTACGRAGFERARWLASDRRSAMPCHVGGLKAPFGGRFTEIGNATRYAAARPGSTDSYTRRTRTVQPRSRCEKFKHAFHLRFGRSATAADAARDTRASGGQPRAPPRALAYNSGFTHPFSGEVMSVITTESGLKYEP